MTLVAYYKNRLCFLYLKVMSAYFRTKSKLKTLGHCPMSKTLYDKLWDEHVVTAEGDGTATIYIDRHLMHEVTSHGRCGSHGGTHQMRAPAFTLTAFEITVGGGGAAIARTQTISVHRQTHRAARFTPLKACFDENLVQTFFFGHHLH